MSPTKMQSTMKRLALGILLVILCFNCFAQQDSVAVKHKVALGENLFRISLKYNVKLDKLKQWNSLTSDAIGEGQELIVGYEVANTKPQPSKSSNTLDYLNRLQKLVDQVENLYYLSLAEESEKRDYADTALLNALFSRQYSENAEYQLMNEMNSVMMQALKDDIGLSFYSSFTHNFEPGIFEGEDLFFRTRANVGLDWQLFGSGFLGNKDEAKRLEVENQINSLLESKVARNENYIYSYNYFIYLFNKSQQKYLERRLSMINSFLEIASQMYLVRATPWEQIVKLKGRKEGLENMAKNLANYNKGFDSAYAELNFDRLLDAESLPVLEIIPEMVFSGVESDSLNQTLVALEKQKVDLEYKKTRDLSFRTYVRYNLYDEDLSDIRSYGSVGATFSVPLFKNRRNSELKEKRLAVLSSRLGNQATAINNELMNHYYEYEYTLKQFLEMYGDKELALERLRRELAKDYLQDPSFTPIDAINYLDQLFAIDFELLDLKQKMYLKLLKIYSLMKDNKASDITRVMNLGNFLDKMAGDRAVYAWSATLGKFDPGFLTKYSINNDFSRLFISPGNTDPSTLESLMELAHKSNQKVYRLIGENSFAKDGQSDGLMTMVQSAMEQGYDGIQLDIEPHTFDDWDNNKEGYLANLTAAISGVRDVIGGEKQLSVSVPLFYSESFLESVEGIVDEFILMCYERPEVEFIVAQISEEVALNQDKVTLALRTDDFADRIELEDFVKKLIDATGIDRIVIHDLGSLISLDQETIMGN